MRATRESFLQFLIDNLPGVEVRNLRRDPQFPELQMIKTGCVNVQFIGDSPEVNVGAVLVTIDVVDEDELTAIDVTKSVWSALSATGYTAQLDYTNPSSPVALGSNIYWDLRNVHFRPVYSDEYFRYSCLLSLSYHPY